MELLDSLNLAITQPARQKVQKKTFSNFTAVAAFSVRLASECSFALCRTLFSIHLRTFWCSWKIKRSSIDWVFEIIFFTNFQTPTASVIGVHESVVVIRDFAYYQRWVFVECYKDGFFCPTSRCHGIYLNDVESKVVSRRAVSIYG